MRRRFVILADDQTTDENLTTDEVVKEDKPEKEGQENPKEKDNPQEEEEFVDPDAEKDEEKQDDQEETEGDEDLDAPDAATPAATPSPVDDVAAEEKPRHDLSVNSVDLVVNASNVIRAAKEVAERYVGEDAGDKSYLKKLWEESDAEGRRMGNIALELRVQGDRVCERIDDACNVSSASDVFCDDDGDEAPIGTMALESITLLLDHIAKRHNLQRGVLKGLATESALGLKTGSKRRRMAMEGFSSVVTSMVDSIARALRAVWRWICDFFGSTEERVKKTAAVAVSLGKRTRDLRACYNKLNSEQKERVASLFEVCQRFDPDRPGDTLSGLPEFIKAKEEIFKKAVSERGYRLNQEDFPSFYVGGVFQQPGDTTKHKKTLGEFTALSDTLLELTGKMLETVDAVALHTLDSLRDQTHFDQAKAAVSELGEGWRQLGGLRKDMEPVDAGSGLAEINNEVALSVVGKQAHAILPNDQVLFAVVPKDSDFDTVSKALPCMTIKLQSNPVTSARVKALVNHTLIGEMERGLADFVDVFLDGVVKIVETKAKVIKDLSDKLVTRMESVKKYVAEGETADSSKIALLNSCCKFTTTLSTQFIPSLIKMMTNLASDFFKHAMRSLAAFEMVLEFV